VRFLATVCAAVAACFALTGHASNILTNPGFDQTPGFTGWSAHTTEGWSYATHTDQYISPPNDLWMQGLYGNGGAPNTGYVSFVYQTFPTSPGFTYTADAYFSQYVLFFGVAGQPTEGGDNGNATAATGASGLFNNNDTGTYYEDGYVEVVFWNSASNSVLADYKSVIIDPTFEQSILNDTSSVVVPSVNTNYPPPAVVTNVYLTWIDVPVTNQYDPTTLALNQDPSVNDPHPHTPMGTGTITNTLGPGQVMVAPPGAAYVEFRLCLYQLSFASGAPHWDNCTLNQVSGQQQDVISAITPSAGVFLTNTSFSFNVNTPSIGVTTPTNGIKVVVNGLNESSSLLFSGNNTNWNVTLPGLVSNTIYSISISASNTAALVASASSRFDTFGPGNFVVPAETYDYNGGVFIQNPVPSTNAGPTSYWGLSGIPSTDYFIEPGGGVSGGGNDLQPGYPNRGTNTDAAWQIPSDPQLPIYIAQGAPTSGVYNVTIAYNNAGPANTGGDWYNYTRNPYPSGSYLVYARMSSGNGAAAGINGGPGGEFLNLQLTGHGTSPSTYTNIGIFIPTINNDWGTYYWYLLTDANHNVLVVNVPPGQQTLQLVSAGNCNVSYFMFAPLPALGLPPAIIFVNPPLTAGGNVFVSTNNLTFTVSSLTSTIATNNIGISLNGINVSALSTFSGNNTNWSVSLPVSANDILTLVVNATDANGLSQTNTASFDTFSQSNFMIEAEDYDFQNGQFIDNPVPTGPIGEVLGSYYGDPNNNPANVAVLDVDLTTSNTVALETFLYRFDNLCGTEVTTDFVRTKFTNGPASVGLPGVASDYDVGWWTGGSWLNYTRTFPTNNYYVYGRLAGGGPYSGTTLSLVTGGWGTTSQTTQLEGSFADPNASGFQVWHWVPLLNTNGQMVTMSLGGTNTIKLTSGGDPTYGGNPNANYYMFVPVTQSVNVAASVSGTTLSLKFPTHTGNAYTVLYNNSLKGGTWSAVAGPISGDGTIKIVPISTSGSPGFYKVWIQ